MYFLLGLLLGLIVGGGGLYAFLTVSGKNVLDRARTEADHLRQNTIKEAQTAAREIELSAKQEQLKLRETFEAEANKSRREAADRDKQLDRREDELARKADVLVHKERQIADRDKALTRREDQLVVAEKELADSLAEQKRQLRQLTGMNEEQAREMYLKRVEDECRAEAGEIIRRTVEQAQDEARDKARQVILEAIQRYAADQTADHTVSSVTIPDDAMKGRVIGREGRNIRSFEKATGVDVIIDDTPGVVVVSCFDPVRREIARTSLERLVADGRIHPARIEEIVTASTEEMEQHLADVGKEAAHASHVQNLARPIIPLLGRLSFRTSYGQNVLKHSQEVAYLAQIMADELGLDGQLARRAGLLHDIGKALDHEIEGGHPAIGADLLRKHGEPEAVINAAAAHHGDVPATTPYTPLIMAADAISAGRPGARRESLERYIKRLKELEELATGFKGVRQAYAIQAGREIRVIVDARAIDDRTSAKLAHDIAKQIEGQLSYPGEIKITVLREVRTVEYAR